MGSGFYTNEITNEMEASPATGETDETRGTRTCSSGPLLRLTETHEMTAMQLPRWGSRVRIPSSAPEKDPLTSVNAMASDLGPC